MHSSETCVCVVCPLYVSELALRAPRPRVPPLCFCSDKYEFNGLARQGYVVRFAHTTPSSVFVSVATLAPKDWVVVALPYRAGTQLQASAGNVLACAR